MLIYEVAIQVDAEILPEYIQWMSEQHVPEVLESPGFVKAEFMLEPDGKPRVRVLYFVKDAPSLKRYLSEIAPRLRQQSLDKWNDRFTAERSIWALYGTMKPAGK